MWYQLESASANPTRVSGEGIVPLDAKGWASVLPFQSLAKVGAGGKGLHGLSGSSHLTWPRSP